MSFDSVQSCEQLTAGNTSAWVECDRLQKVLDQAQQKFWPTVAQNMNDTAKWQLDSGADRYKDPRWGFKNDGFNKVGGVVMSAIQAAEGEQPKDTGATDRLAGLKQLFSGFIPTAEASQRRIDVASR